MHFNPEPLNPDDHYDFYYDLASRTDVLNNLCCIVNVLPKLLIVIPFLTWKLVNSLENKCLEELNVNIINNILSESRQVQLSENVAEKLNAEVPITSECVETLIIARVKKETNKQNAHIAELEKSLRLLSTSPRNTPSTINPKPILRNKTNISNKKYHQQKNYMANPRNCGSKR